MRQNLQKIIVITGPTASGKTDFSIKLAQKINAEIIIADSRAVYRGFDIVSAKPSKEERGDIKHHLIDIKNPNEDFSAGDFVYLAEDIIKDIFSRNKRVIISGGTWFYIKALLGDKKLPEIKADINFREELQKKESTLLWNILYQKDQKRASEIDKNNKDKIIRSIEMCRFLNGPISEYKRAENKKYESVWYYPKTDREILYEKINKRVDNMMNMGLFEEFKKNIEMWGADNKIINNTIGYQEFMDFCKKDEAIEKIKQHTRNFAKRQLSYFRNDKNIIPLDSFDKKALEDIE